MNFIEELRWRGMIHDMMPGTEECLQQSVLKTIVLLLHHVDKTLCAILVLAQLSRIRHLFQILRRSSDLWRQK